MFKDFGKRLQRDVRRLVEGRLGRKDAVEINVVTHKKQRYAVWFGGSLLGSTAAFTSYCHTKAEYEEHGPSIARHNRVFTSF